MMGFDVGWYEDILLPIIPQSGIHPCKPSSSLDGGIWGMRLAWDWMGLDEIGMDCMVWMGFAWIAWDWMGFDEIVWDWHGLHGL